MEKIFLVNIYPLLLVCSKKVVQTNPNFPQDFPLFKYGKKTNWQSFSVLVSATVTFMLKENVLYEFPPKRFKTTERHSLAVYCPLSGEKQFLLIFIPIY